MGRVTGKPNGRPLFVPTDEQRRQVSMFVGFGLKLPEIAQLIVDPRTQKTISERTVATKFKAELAAGKQTLIARVAASLMRKAMGDGQGAVAAAIFILKTRGGENWRETSRTEITGADGGPVGIYDAADLAKLTDEDLEAVKNVVTKLKGVGQKAAD